MKTDTTNACPVCGATGLHGCMGPRTDKLDDINVVDHPKYKVDQTHTTIAAIIEHMDEWAREQAIDGPITPEELDGILMAVEELKRFSEPPKPMKTADHEASNMREALEAIWPFCAEECGMLITKSYGEAICKVAVALGKSQFVLQDRGNGMFYVEGRHD